MIGMAASFMRAYPEVEVEYEVDIHKDSEVIMEDARKNLKAELSGENGPMCLCLTARTFLCMLEREC